MSNENRTEDDVVVLMSLIDSDNIELHFEGTDDGNKPKPESVSSSDVDLVANASGTSQTINSAEPSTLKRKTSLQCEFCLKTFTARTNLHRHKKLCSFNAGKKNTGYNCLTCGKIIARSDSFSRHQMICSVKTERRVSCWHDDCISTFYRKTDLIEHLKFQHGLEVKDEKELTFQNVTEFKAWKEEMEESSYSYFSKRKGSSGNVDFYYCQQDGSSKAHRKIGDETRKTGRRNKKGQIRKDKTCIAYIRVRTEKNGSLAVTYQPTHCHPLDPEDFRHHPLSSATESYINKQLELGVSPAEIAASLINSSAKCDENGKPGLSKNSLINILTRINGKMWRRQARMKDNRDAAIGVKEKQRSLKLATMRATAISNIKNLLELAENEAIPDTVLAKIETTTTDLLNDCQAIADQSSHHCDVMRET